MKTFVSEWFVELIVMKDSARVSVQTVVNAEESVTSGWRRAVKDFPS